MKKYLFLVLAACAILFSACSASDDGDGGGDRNGDGEVVETDEAAESPESPGGEPTSPDEDSPRPGDSDRPDEDPPGPDGDGSEAADGDLPEGGEMDADIEASEGEEEADAPTPAVPRLRHFFPPTTPLGGTIDESFETVGGTPPYSNWRVLQGELPPNTALDPDTGAWSGSPMEEGFYYFVIGVDDNDGVTLAELFGIRIGDPDAAGPMAKRARDYQDVYVARHLWNGLSLGARTPDDPEGNYRLTTYGDCAFVSGQCTMAQAFRYGALKSEEALAVLGGQIEGWRFFQRMTGVPGLIGRCYAHIDDPWNDGEFNGRDYYPENPDGRFYRGTGEFDGYLWRGDASRDQVTGAVLGMAMAHDLVDDPELKQTAATFLTELADHVWDNGLYIVDPGDRQTTYGEMDAYFIDGLPVRNGLNAVCDLAWFKVAHHVSGEERFSEYYEELAVDRDYISIMRDHQWVYNLMGYNIKWYNTYMAFENWFHLMRLENDPVKRPLYHEIFRDTLWLNIEDKTRNRRGIKEYNPVKTAWYLYSTGEHNPEILYHALWQLVVFPEAPLRDRRVENSSNPDIEKNPDEPTEALYPLPSNLRTPDMVIWHRNPFSLDGGSDSGEERTGCDYLLPYWMAVYYGYLNNEW